MTIFEWGNGFSTEGALLAWCPVETIRDIVLLAAALNSQQQVDQHIQNCSQGAYNFEACTEEPTLLAAATFPQRLDFGYGRFTKSFIPASICTTNSSSLTTSLRSTISSEARICFASDPDLKSCPIIHCFLGITTTPGTTNSMTRCETKQFEAVCCSSKCANIG